MRGGRLAGWQAAEKGYWHLLDQPNAAFRQPWARTNLLIVAILYPQRLWFIGVDVDVLPYGMLEANRPQVTPVDGGLMMGNLTRTGKAIS